MSNIEKNLKKILRGKKGVNPKSIYLKQRKLDLESMEMYSKGM